MIQELSKLADVATIGLLPNHLWKNRDKPMDDSPGLEHELIIWDRKPELWHRWCSWRKLRGFYLEKCQREGPPDILLVRNLQHVFNYFVNWLRAQPRRPLIVLLLGDSGLGQTISWRRRLRYKFKPMQMLEDQAARLYDACLVSSPSAKRFFEPRGIPCLWIPCAFHYDYTPPPPDPAQNGPIQFGYFGALSEHSSVLPLVRGFLDANVPGALHVCGHGPLSRELQQLAARHPNFHFDGFLPRQSDCPAWGQKVDVLINVRLPLWGQENSVPSKVFEYAAAGKAILSTRTAGMDAILGEEGIYIETGSFGDSLRDKLREVSAMPRPELQRRGAMIRSRILAQFSWAEQSRRIVEFLESFVGTRPAKVQA
ncbi:MAG: glycosyltransferase [Verrucomicrobia bacterium]|nr:glycosyltransferase [Verrucomicrobiota bacterium]MDE3098739.1 glycosyltransferase family 4 protein [Verrucomicrobiota bacterium]